MSIQRRSVANQAHRPILPTRRLGGRRAMNRTVLPRPPRGTTIRIAAARRVAGATAPAAPTNQAPSNQDAPPSPWRNSKAKKLLHDDIVAGRTKNMGPTAVFKSRPEFGRYKKENFMSNYYTLRKAVARRIMVASKGQQAFNRDAAVIANRRNESGTFFYCGSDLQKQLRYDVESGLTRGKTPSQVRASQIVYQNPGMPLQKFANHLAYERKRVERRSNQGDFRERMDFITARINPTNEDSQNGEEE